MKTKLTPQERLEVYENMLECTKDDLRFSLEYNIDLESLCFFAIDSNSYISLLPELLEQKPIKPYSYGYWWSTDPHSKDYYKRIEAIEKAIAEVKTKI